MNKLLSFFLFFPLLSFAQIDSFNMVYSNSLGLNHAKFTQKVTPLGNINLIQTKDFRQNALGNLKVIPDTYQYDLNDRLTSFQDITYNFSADIIYQARLLSISYGTTTVKESVITGNPFSPPTYFKTETYEDQSTLPFLHEASFYKSGGNQAWGRRINDQGHRIYIREQ